MKVAFQMDPIKKVDPKADSTFRIAVEAQLRGHLLFYYEPNKLTSENGKAIASGHFFKIIGKENESVQLGPEEVVELSEFDVVWLRQDPPFDMHYITTTFILDALKPQTLVVNDPFWVRNLPEKFLLGVDRCQGVNRMPTLICVGEDLKSFGAEIRTNLVPISEQKTCHMLALDQTILHWFWPV